MGWFDFDKPDCQGETSEVNLEQNRPDSYSSLRRLDMNKFSSAVFRDFDSMMEYFEETSDADAPPSLDAASYKKSVKATIKEGGLS